MTDIEMEKMMTGDGTCADKIRDLALAVGRGAVAVEMKLTDIGHDKDLYDFRLWFIGCEHILSKSRKM